MAPPRRPADRFYDDTGTLVTELTVDRAAQLCGDPAKVCWTPISTKGYRYKDRDASADGVQKIVVKGGSAGRGKVVLKAGTVQLVTSDGECFGGSITDISRTDLGAFKAFGAVGAFASSTSTSTSRDGK
jgi:hypothetical protein